MVYNVILFAIMATRRKKKPVQSQATETKAYKTDAVMLRFYPGEREEMTATAKDEGFSTFAEWARVTLRNAAKRKAPQ